MKNKKWISDQSKKIGNDKRLNKKTKALILFSGGLDSILSVEILKRQGIYCEGLFFASPFWDSDPPEEKAKNISLKLNIIKLGDDYLRIIKKPKFSRGKYMNPCLDCRIFMLKLAKGFIKLKKFDILVTGEVLGQRPMTQNKKSFNFIEKKSELCDKILRPLSAKRMPETIYENRGLIDRKKLFGFQGRGRKPQMDLAEKWKIKNYPTPSGGCLLTDEKFSNRLKELFEKYPRCKIEDTELLKFGRHFWEGKIKIVVGRNDEENKKLKKLARENDILLELKKIPGPITLIRGKANKKILEKAKNLIIRYANKADKNTEVKIRHIIFKK